MRNKDPQAPWYNPVFNNPEAPHVRNKDDPTKAWNQVFWHPEQLTKDERVYYCIDYEYYSWKEKFKQHGKKNNRTD